jgi:hypothetical protein
MAKKKAHRTTHRSTAGTKLYAKRDAKGEFTDIQTYKRAHGQDIKRVSAAETAAKAGSVALPGKVIPIPVPGSAASPVTAPFAKAASPSKAPAKKAAAKPAAKKTVAKKAAPKKAAPKKAVKKVVKKKKK